MDIRETEEFIDLKRRKEKRQQKKYRKYILSEICKMFFLLIIGGIVAAVIVPQSEAAPVEALLIYECATIIGSIVLVSFCLDKLRKKK